MTYCEECGVFYQDNRRVCDLVEGRRHRTIVEDAQLSLPLVENDTEIVEGDDDKETDE